MPTLELVITACLLADPRHCQETRLVYAEAPAVCLHVAMHEVVKWTDEHPTWHVTRWSCGPYSKAKHRA